MKWNFLKFLGRQLKDQYWYRHKMIFNSRKLKHSQLRTGSLEKALPKTELKKALAGAKIFQGRDDLVPSLHHILAGIAIRIRYG